MNDDEKTDYTGRLARYIVEASQRALPDEVMERAKLHVLDALAAMISGASLETGKRARELVSRGGVSDEATVVGLPSPAAAADAALANGMAAHADESDDSHTPSRTHPGCAVVPAALAMAERERRSGSALLRAVCCGYDVGCRAAMALGPVPGQVHASVIDTYAVGAAFGAAAAAASLSGLTVEQARSALAFTTQQAWGFGSYMRAPNHDEKAFVFGGKPARDGVLAATMVQAGLIGTPDALDGHINYLDSVSAVADPPALVDGLGERWEVLRASIKRYPVGFPVVLVLEALDRILARSQLSAGRVTDVEVRLPPSPARTVDRRPMPDMNVQYLTAVAILDGSITFASSHDAGRMTNPEVSELMDRVRLIADQDMQDRQARVEIQTTDGRRLAEHVFHADVRGTTGNPMTRADVTDKALDLMAPFVGSDAANRLIRALMDIERLSDVRALRPMLAYKSGLSGS